MPADSADDFPLKELCYQIRGLLFKVQNDLGTKFQEKHYVKALCSLLQQAGLKYLLEVPFTLVYNGVKLGSFRADMVVNGKVLLEFKTVEYLNDDHFKQTLRYLEALNLPVAYVVNFRKRPLQIRRIINSKSALSASAPSAAP